MGLGGRKPERPTLMLEAFFALYVQPGTSQLYHTTSMSCTADR